MINVYKKELKERTFIPYEFTITISSEQDHRNFKEACRHLKDKDSYFFKKSGPFAYICEQILNHIS